MGRIIWGIIICIFIYLVFPTFFWSVVVIIGIVILYALYNEFYPSYIEWKKKREIDEILNRASPVDKPLKNYDDIKLNIRYPFYLKRNSKSEILLDEAEMDYFLKAAQIVVIYQKCSDYFLRGRLRTGSNRVENILNQLEIGGIITSAISPSTILIPDEFHLEQHLKEIIKTKIVDKNTEKKPLDLDDSPMPQTKNNSKKQKDENYNPALEYAQYEYPTLELLDKLTKQQFPKKWVQEKKGLLQEFLTNNRLIVKNIDEYMGPMCCLLKLENPIGINVSKIEALKEEFCLALSVKNIRVAIYNRPDYFIGIEVPYEEELILGYRDLISSVEFINFEGEIPIAFGKTPMNKNVIEDLSIIGHLFILGNSNQEYATFLDSLIATILYKKHPSEIKFVLIDPLKIRLNIFNPLERHFLAKVPGDDDTIITNEKSAINTLNSLCVLMDTRYDLLKDAGVYNIKEYNLKLSERKLNPEQGHHFMPYIIVVIDELADLFSNDEMDITYPIDRLAGLSKNVGIHLIIAIEPPTAPILKHLEIENFQFRSCFWVKSKNESKHVIDSKDVEILQGKGDMLLSSNGEIQRIQSHFLSKPKLEKIITFISNQRGIEPFRLPKAKKTKSKNR